MITQFIGRSERARSVIPSKVRILLCVLCATSVAIAQSKAQTPRPVWPFPIDLATATTGSEDEESLLLLQLVGRAPLVQTTIRSFTATELDALASIESSRETTPFGAAAFSETKLSLTYNTNRAFGDNDGVIWAGRGLTAAISGGAISRVGPFSFALRPVAFWTQNLPYQPPAAALGDSGFRVPIWGNGIDLPYRFGNRWYGRLDPGESWAQLDTRLVAAGISTATQAWGPMHVYPLLLGPNAGGFPHVFAGSGLPWNVIVGKLGVRTAVGRLDPSAFAAPHAGDSRRLASELVATFTPTGLDGLEIGGGRFFHRRWPTEGIGLSVLEIPFEGFLKNGLQYKDAANAVQDNELASLFFRIVRPASGIEFYGEFLRDDNSYDVKDLIGEPDHESAYALGLRRAWIPGKGDGSLTSLTIEYVNGRISHLSRLRGEDPMYWHTSIVEGHTERGQLLASPAAFGGEGFEVDLLHRNQGGSGWRVTLNDESLLQQYEGGSVGGTMIGYSAITASLQQSRGLFRSEIGLSVQRGWNKMSNADNVTMKVDLSRAGRAIER